MMQIIINSIISGLCLSLMAIGFTYIFRITKVFHIAHGGIYIVGAYATWWLFSITHSWLLSVFFALITVSVLIFLIEKAVYLPLHKKHYNQSISLIASMGLYIVIVNLSAVIFGNETKVYGSMFVGSFQWGELIITKMQCIQTFIASFTILCFFLYVKVSNSKLTLQSVSDNETIGKVFGINTDYERMKIFIIGSVLACISAILKTLEIGLDPHAGMNLTLTAVVITILASRLDIVLIITSSITLIMIQNFLEWFLNTQWRDGVTFLLLLLVILYRTEGIISYNLRKDRL